MLPQHLEQNLRDTIEQIKLNNKKF